MPVILSKCRLLPTGTDRLSDNPELGYNLRTSTGALIPESNKILVFLLSKILVALRCFGYQCMLHHGDELICIMIISSFAYNDGGGYDCL